MSQIANNASYSPNTAADVNDHILVSLNKEGHPVCVLYSEPSRNIPASRGHQSTHAAAAAGGGGCNYVDHSNTDNIGTCIYYLLGSYKINYMILPSLITRIMSYHRLKKFSDTMFSDVTGVTHWETICE